MRDLVYFGLIFVVRRGKGVDLDNLDCFWVFCGGGTAELGRRLMVTRRRGWFSGYCLNVSSCLNNSLERKY